MKTIAVSSPYEVKMGLMHDKAQQRLKEYFERRSQVSCVYLDQRIELYTGDRLGVVPYHPDVLVFFHTPSSRCIWIEVDGRHNHSGSRNAINRKTREEAVANYGGEFFAFSTKELVGNGWKDSKGFRHNVWPDEYLDRLFFGAEQ